MTYTYLVPVRPSAGGTLALRTGRLRSGERVGLAFTTEAALQRAMGSSGRWVRLGGDALRDLLAPLGVLHVRIDPLAASGLLRHGAPRG